MVQRRNDHRWPSHSSLMKRGFISAVTAVARTVASGQRLIRRSTYTIAWCSLSRNRVIDSIFSDSTTNWERHYEITNYHIRLTFKLGQNCPWLLYNRTILLHFSYVHGANV
jgi:hypothetical protein